MDGQQQQQKQQLHRSVVDGIACLTNPRYRHERRKLIVSGWLGKPPVDRQSLDHLVDFLDDIHSHEVVITELRLEHVYLVSQPSPDGGLNVLRDFFAKSVTTLTKVNLDCCYFGSQEDASQLLAAFQTNRTVVELNIQEIRNLEGAALGACLSSLTQNMPQLQRLACYYSILRVQGVHAFQPGLQANRTLRELSLWSCDIGDEGIRQLADALVGNTTMQVLNIGCNYISSNGLDDITRLLNSTQLRTINFWQSRGVFNYEDATQHFVATLQHKNSSVQELPGINPHNFPNNITAANYASIKSSLTRNQQLNHVNLLLAPPSPMQQQQQRNAGTMMLKISHKAIIKFAKVPNNVGASAIFKLFTARPHLLEKRLKRPASSTAAVSQEQKRRRF